MVFDSQPTKSVPRRVRLAIERNIDVMCPNRHPQSRMQHENLDVRSVGATRPLRGVALFDATCDLTDEDAQEATVRACHSVKHGVIIGSEKPLRILHDVVYMATRSRCPLHHDPDRLQGCTFRGTVLALETLHRSEGSAWLGRDLRQRLDSNLPDRTHSTRADCWEGLLHIEELFHLPKTVIQGEASHAMQFAQRLRDTADEELVTPLETFVASAHGEPNLAEELDRADEAAEAEVDEETPSPAQQRQLLRAHVNLGHPTIGEFCRALLNGRCRRRVVR